MVKNVILIFSFLMLTACSGKGTDVELKVSKSFAIAAQNGGGAVLYISNPDTKDTKTIVVEQEEVTITLLNGNWDFSVVSWSGSIPLTGDMACANKSAVLSGEKVEIDLEPTLEECETSKFSQKQISFVNCHSLTGLTAGETCDGSARGQAGSYQIRFESAGNKGLSSVCVQAEADPISTVQTNLSLPFSYIKDFKFDLFSDANCSSGKKTFSHHEAFNDEGTLYFAYGTVGSTPPIATNINPPEGVLGVESIITLSYVDYNLDLATSCTVSNLSYLMVSTPCTCSLGVCTVGVLETTNYVGQVGFDYIVTANGETSNTASASFNLIEPDYAPVAQGISDAGIFALSPLTLDLPYTDANYDEATSCEISNYYGSITPDICTCSLGVCNISISPSGYGLASFEYKVTANGVVSTPATVSFSILEAPVVEYPPYLTAQFNQNVNLGPLSVSHNGEISTCTISPALPTGLAFDPYSCIISGTAAVVLNPTVFTVVATNSAGSTSTNFTFEVEALPPTVNYTAALASDFYTQESLVITPIINENGSPITSCAVTPTLPVGLSINNNSCEIIGIPTIPINQNFNISAQNAAGTTTLTINLKIQSAFITTWQTVANNESITLPLVSGVSYNFRVDWGDGTDSIITSWDSLEKTHSYSVMDTYTVKIYGQFPQIEFFGSGEESKILTVEQWGTSKWLSMQHAFANCSNLQVTALDSPDLSEAQSLSAMFMNATNFNSNISHWNTETITDMSYMFKYATSFNQPIGAWNTSNVTNMSYMFSGATSFNQPIGTWNTLNVNNMSAMFENSNFNQVIDSWDTSNVTNMSMMFLNATNFNQPLFSWITSNVMNFDSMFSNASLFNQDISNWIIQPTATYSNFDYGTSGAWVLKPPF